MRKWTAAVAALACVGSLGSAAAADALADCYRAADSKGDIQACLRRELAETEKFYEDIVDRVLADARDLDRVQKRKDAAKAFEDSNKAFMRYVEAECKWVEESSGASAGASNAVLACRINLLKLRAGSLDAQFLSTSR